MSDLAIALRNYIVTCCSKSNNREDLLSDPVFMGLLDSMDPDNPKFSSWSQEDLLGFFHTALFLAS